MLKFIYILLLIFLVGFYNVAPNNMDKTIISVLLIIALCSLILFFLLREKNPSLKGQYLKHSTLALTGIVIVCFQYPLDFVLGNVSASDLYIWVNTQIVIKSLTLSVIGLLCFLLGYLLYNRKDVHQWIKKEQAVNVKVLNILAAAALVIYFLTINPLYLMGYYGVVEMGVQASYAIMFFNIFVFASVIQKCRNMRVQSNFPNNFWQYLKRMGWLLMLLTGLYLLSVLVSGDRGPLIIYSLLFFSGYFIITKKKLSLKYMILFLIIGISFIAFLRTIRSLNKDLNFSEKISRSLNNPETTSIASISTPTLELAGSIKALNTAVNYVPEKHDFFYGRFQFQQILRLIPFFDIFYPLIFHDEPMKFDRYGSSARYVTWITLGDFPYKGIGTSVMTDFYLDFGLFGLIIGMFLFGYMMRLSEVAMYSERIPLLFVQVFYVVYFCEALYIARGTLLADLRTVVWIFLILLLNKHFLQYIVSGKKTS